MKIHEDIKLKSDNRWQFEKNKFIVCKYLTYIIL